MNLPCRRIKADEETLPLAGGTLDESALPKDKG